ncbi:RNA polymerase sigma factor [Steroidobacter sp.]|uniref:RNA polymerase sigma factor n=1 Tax=Steroidobacter sp. TaxID=1978227 RepID=UPI001A4B8FE1|nr:RNA polymerase sigma factor [Steroidobacter sp.]MBL8266666.1 RNA polymerase sigma factor [Steroidobacter sp.]
MNVRADTVTTPNQRSFVTAIEQAYSTRLRRFIASRLGRGRADLPDLIQEIYLRLLRIKDYEAIRNPQAYLFTVATHVLHQYRLRRLQTHEVIDPLRLVDDAHDYLQVELAPDPADELDIEQRLEELGEELMRVSPRAYAALVMYRCEGMTLVEIGEQLGVSHVMVRKYLSRAIAFCDARLDEIE